MIAFLLLASIATTSDFTSELKANAASWSPSYPAKATAAEKFLADAKTYGSETPYECGDGSLIQTIGGGYFGYIAKKRGQTVEWVLDLSQDNNVLVRFLGADSRYLALAEHHLLNAPEGSLVWAATLLNLTDARPVWRWFLQESPTYEKAEGVLGKWGWNDDWSKPKFSNLSGNGVMKYADGVKLIPGYCAMLDESGMLPLDHAQKYFAMLAERRVKEEEDRFRYGSGVAANAVYKRQSRINEWGEAVDQVCRSIAVLSDYAGRLASCAESRGPASSLTGAEQKNLASACAFDDVLDQQLSREEAVQLLKTKYLSGVKLFVKAFNAATAKSLIPKSPKISKEFTPNTATLIRAAFAVESLTPAQIRRVNACYLLDSMRSDMAFTAP